MKRIDQIFKYKKNIIIIILDLILSLFISLFITNRKIEFLDLKNFNIWIFLLILIFVSYIFSHFVFNIKNIYKFIYNKRYLLAFIILIILVLGKFNGSSIGMWNNYIQPSEDYSNKTIFGENRAIRSDEWLVNLSYTISQEYNDYSYYNDLPRGTKTDMYTSIFVPVKDILILARPFNIGYILFGEEYGLSFYWYGRLIALLLVTFEFCMLITNKKKLPSIVGTIIITGSPVVSWFYSNYIVDLLISGQLCLLMFNAFLTTKNKKSKIIYSILIAFGFNWFALTLYPAWQVPLGYMYLVFAIWILIKNIENNKHIKDYLYLLITFALIIIIVGRFLLLGKDTIKIIMSTVYPGNRVINGGGATILNFVYPISILFPIADYINPCEASGVYSIFPIPILVSIIYLFKNKKENDNNKEKTLLKMLTILAIILTIFTIFKLPSILTKITLLSMSPTQRVVPIIGIICTYILIITIGKLKIEKNYLKVIVLISSIILSIAIVYLGNLNKIDYMTLKKIIVEIILLFITIYMYLTSYKKINKIIICILLIVIGIENILLVNPINIGTEVLHKKSAAKEIQKIVNTDKNAIWASTDSYMLSNYVLINGGKAINSTNIYPNLELWKKIDKNKKYIKVYNRYAHIIIKLTDNKTKFELQQADLFIIYLNYDDIDKLGIDYFITSNKLELSDEYSNRFKKIYHKDNIWIYKYS